MINTLNMPVNVPESEKNKTVRKSFSEFANSIWGFFDRLTDLQEGIDREGTILNIKNNKRMKGANAWLLMCSIMIASIGLDLDSPAVIIGAMLISPLMSPILGVGMSVGINDKATLYVSLRHFGIAIAIALITSTFYFWITPFGDATDQILTRTKPNTLDALVAFFGGIAGIISGSRIDKSNAIPGVAIATALMPPLCVTGFGIANLDLTIVINSFYLFFLNATLVAFATYLIVRLLNFPSREFENSRERRRTAYALSGISLLIILPSFYILFQVLKDANLKRNVSLFLTEYCGEDNMHYVDSWKLYPRDSVNQIAIKVYGTGEKRFNVKDMEKRIKKFNVPNPRIQIIPTTDVDLDKYNELNAKISNFNSLAEKLEAAKEVQDERDQQIQNLQNKLDSISADTIPFTGIYQDLKIAYPLLNKIAFAQAQVSDFTKSGYIPILLVQWNAKKKRKERLLHEDRIMKIVKNRILVDTIQLVNY